MYCASIHQVKPLKVSGVVWIEHGTNYLTVRLYEVKDAGLINN
jgi:hypothetical protein